MELYVCESQNVNTFCLGLQYSIWPIQTPKKVKLTAEEIFIHTHVNTEHLKVIQKHTR
jgi:hypothetical protein